MDIRAAARLTFQLLRFAAATIFLAPWVAIAVVAALWRLAGAPLRLARTLHAAFANVVYCPRGHRVELVGVWDCRCGARFVGHAFAQCPVCRERPGWLECRVCGLAVSIVNHARP